MSELDHHEEPPLTSRERKEIREILEADRRMKWFWAGARRVSIWFAAFAGALSVGWNLLVEFVLHLSGK